MSWIEFAASYMAIGYALMLIPFLRDGLENERSIVFALWFWPVALILMAVVMAVDASPYRVELVRHDKAELRTWGTRKSDIYDKSFAIRCPWVELQIWRVK